MYTGWGRVGQIPSPQWWGGETGYTVPLIVYNMGEKDDKGLGFPFLRSKTLRGYLLFCPWLTIIESVTH